MSDHRMGDDQVFLFHAIIIVIYHYWQPQCQRQILQMIGRGQLVEPLSCILSLFTLTVQRNNMLCKLLRILTSHEVGPLLATSDTHPTAILSGYFFLFAKGHFHNVRLELDMILTKDEGCFAYIDTIRFHFLCLCFSLGICMNLLGGHLDFLCHTLLDFYLWVVLQIVVRMCQHRCTYLYAFPEVNFRGLTQRMAGIKDVIHQYDDRILWQFPFVEELDVRQVIQTFLDFQVIERRMGRAGEPVIIV